MYTYVNLKITIFEDLIFCDQRVKAYFWQLPVGSLIGKHVADFGAHLHAHY
jgi:hypothetical protein